MIVSAVEAVAAILRPPIQSNDKSDSQEAYMQGASPNGDKLFLQTSQDPREVGRVGTLIERSGSRWGVSLQGCRKQDLSAARDTIFDRRGVLRVSSAAP